MIVHQPANTDPNSSNDREVTFVCCSCRRLPMLLRSMANFFDFCADNHLIARFIVIDDNSSAEDRDSMTASLSPSVTFVFKEKEQAGHAISLNMALQMCKTEFMLYWEDDSFFSTRGNWITDALLLFHHYPNVGQVVLDSNVLSKGHFRYRDSPVPHAICESPPIEMLKDRSEFVYRLHPWPGFTLRPHIVRVSEVISRVGTFDEHDHSHMEYDFSCRYLRSGLDVAVLTDVRVDNAGHPSAYRLNGFPRSWERLGGLASFFPLARIVTRRLNPRKQPPSRQRTDDAKMRSLHHHARRRRSA